MDARPPDAGPPGTGAPDAEPAGDRPGRSSQAQLFEVPGLPGDDEDDPGYRVPTALAAAGITYRQLDYWARTGLVEPSVRGAKGSGSHREYSFRDVVVLKVVKKLLDTGVSLQNVRAAVGHLRSRGVDDLAQITLVSDGASVYECRSRDEVVDVLSGGQCVFAIAIGGVVPEVQGSLARLPDGSEQATRSEDVVGDREGVALPDELSARRRRRASA